MGAVRAALIVAAAVAFFHAVPAAGSAPRAHGRELVAQYQLPAEAVARYAALAADATSADNRGERAASVDLSSWVGPLQQAGAGRNPYTLVLTVSGVAKAAGDVSTQWQTGWEVRESPLATREVLMQVTGQSNAAVAAGAPVSLTAIGTPVSFRGERQVAPTLNLVNAHNLDISDVHLQVWSGSAPLVAWPALAAPQPALLGLGALCLLAWLFLRHATRPAAALKRPPQMDLPLPLEQSKADSLESVPEQTAPPPQNQSSRVVTALRDVLTVGLAVPTEFDPTRRRRGAAKG